VAQWLGDVHGAHDIQARRCVEYIQEPGHAVDFDALACITARGLVGGAIERIGGCDGQGDEARLGGVEAGRNDEACA